MPAVLSSGDGEVAKPRRPPVEHVGRKQLTEALCSVHGVRSDSSSGMQWSGAQPWSDK